jgi:hypothetical protein
MTNVTDRAKPDRGFLTSVGVDPEITVEFQFNPNQIIDRRTVGYASLNAPGMLLPLRQYVSGGDRTLTFTVIVDGAFRGATRVAGKEVDRKPEDRIAFDPDGGIGRELDKYRAFLYPQTDRWQDASTASDGFSHLYATGQPVFVAPPRCLLKLGPREIPCLVTEVVITERMHTPTLAPLRAEVQITCVELTPYDPGLGIGGKP